MTTTQGKTRFAWRRAGEKLWLEFSAGGRAYEVPFGPSRFVDGLVLFRDEGTRPLVKGIVDPTAFLDGLAETCPEAEVEIERHQAKVKLEMGIPLDHLSPGDVDPGYPGL